MRFPHLAAFALILSTGSASAQRITAFTLEDAGELPTLKKKVSLTAQMPTGAHFSIEDSTDLSEWKQVSPIIRSTGVSFGWEMLYALPRQPNTPPVPNSTSTWTSSRFYRIRQHPAPSPLPHITGSAVPPVGSLTRTPTGPFVLITPGGWTIRLDGTTLTISNPSNRDHYELWGDGSGGTGHENLNGKHIKDNFGGARTILLPDNTIVTVPLSTTPGTNTITGFSIYTDEETHRLTSYPDGNGSPNTVILSTHLIRAGEADEADGETCRLIDTPNGMIFENIYIRNTPDGEIIQQSMLLGKTGGPANPNQINDYYDDPRIGHT